MYIFKEDTSKVWNKPPCTREGPRAWDFNIPIYGMEGVFRLVVSLVSLASRPYATGNWV